MRRWSACLEILARLFRMAASPLGRRGRPAFSDIPKNSRRNAPVKTKIRLLFAVAIASAVASNALADTKSHRKAAEDLLSTMGVEAQIEKSIDQTLELQIKQNAQIAPFKEVMKKFLSKHMSYPSLKEDFITIYVEAFTEQELKDIQAFYKTPLGKKVAEKMPEVSGKGMQLGAKRVSDNQAELLQMIQAEIAKPKN
jgi:hypothetical protein